MKIGKIPMKNQEFFLEKFSEITGENWPKTRKKWMKITLINLRSHFPELIFNSYRKCYYTVIC